ncbi:hypothetical protein ABC733_21115 [Mangrovibacter sp. SLW1]
MDKGKANQRSHSGWYTVAVGVALAVLVAFLYGVLYWYFATDASQETSVIISVVVRSGLLLLVMLSLMVLAWLGMQLRQLVRIRQAARLQPAPLSAATGAGARLAEQIRHRLKMRHRLWWRSSVRLVLVVGDNNAVEQLLPGLVAETWLESEHLVFIYGEMAVRMGMRRPLPLCNGCGACVHWMALCVCWVWRRNYHHRPVTTICVCWKKLAGFCATSLRSGYGSYVPANGHRAGERSNPSPLTSRHGQPRKKSALVWKI